MRASIGPDGRSDRVLAAAPARLRALVGVGVLRALDRLLEDLLGLRLRVGAAGGQLLRQEPGALGDGVRGWFLVGPCAHGMAVCPAELRLMPRAGRSRPPLRRAPRSLVRHLAATRRSPTRVSARRAERPRAGRRARASQGRTQTIGPALACAMVAERLSVIDAEQR